MQLTVLKSWQRELSEIMTQTVLQNGWRKTSENRVGVTVRLMSGRLYQ